MKSRISELKVNLCKNLQLRQSIFLTTLLYATLHFTNYARFDHQLLGNETHTVVTRNNYYDIQCCKNARNSRCVIRQKI